MPQIVTSLIRTLVPWIVGFVLAYAAKISLPLPTELANEVVTLILGGLYYLGARLLERSQKKWGWLLGVPKAPTYDATVKVDEQSPTGESAAPESDIPEGDPVEVLPVGDYEGEHRDDEAHLLRGEG